MFCVKCILCVMWFEYLLFVSMFGVVVMYVVYLLVVKSVIKVDDLL